jgi:hypothetical protein
VSRAPTGHVSFGLKIISRIGMIGGPTQYIDKIDTRP